MHKDALRLFDGLLWYLEARNWAYEKLQISPHGSELFDLRMHHSLFFVNLMSAVDHVTDYLRNGKESERSAFLNRIKRGFGETSDYTYTRELRNAVVHRGFDPCESAHSDQTTLYILCPLAVSDIKGNEYSSSFKYLRELATKCREVIDPAITDVLEELHLFEVILHKPALGEVMNSVDGAAAMPDWAKALAKQAFAAMNFDGAASELTQSRVDKMRQLLSRSS